MFNVNNAPVTPSELEVFAAVVANEIDNQPLDPEIDALVLAVDDRSSVAMFSTRDPSHPSSLARIDQLLTTPRRMIAMVSPTGWSPSEDVPVTPAWILVAVGIGGVPALVAVRRTVDGDPWFRADPSALPWFALSTAGALRAVIEHGAPFRFKEATAPELYRRPDEVPEPPLDEHGGL